jgi:hypothetical protein
MAWMRSNVTKRPFIDWLAHSFASLVLILLFFCVLCLIFPENWNFSRATMTTWKFSASVALWVIVGFALYMVTLPWGVTESEWRKEIRKNKISQLHARLLICLVMVTFFLALSAYGYDLVNYILSGKDSIAAYVAKTGGWLTLIASIVGSIFTAVKSAPSGGDDKNTAKNMSDKSRRILFITPPLVLITFTILLSWFARSCIYALSEILEVPLNNASMELSQIIPSDGIPNEEPFIIAVISSIVLAFFFAIYEWKQWKGWVKPSFSFLGLLGLCGLFSWLITLIPRDETRREMSYWKWSWIILFTMAFFVGAMLCFRLFLFRKQRLKPLNDLTSKQQIWVAIFVALVIGVSLAFLTYWLTDWWSKKHLFPPPPAVNWIRISFSIVGILFCGIAVILEMFLSMKNTGRSAVLLTGSYIILLAFLLSGFFSDPTSHREISLAYLTLSLLTLSLGWTIAIGWMSDPNWLSMHLFYKARLVRSYLGASNPQRKAQEITQSAIGDDVMMYDLANCQKGAPYHLVNTTLNLIGAKDLATAQRSSSYFTLSKLYCGSLRTGYRRTREYMDGRFSLGTAVAVSGAAVSPNMGVKTQTAALSMLMTLLNVRLGFWSPTPNNASWRTPNPRLWPFYTLTEFFSQTNDLGSYCYLTDGGHFDNTGLYSLVERGCRFIVVSDNGADPLPCFEDLGDAIRRCRIDFHAEIDLDISPFFKKKDEVSGDQLAQRHYVVGTIKYASIQLQKLGWSEADILTKSEGIIILIKPSLISNEIADLRQYSRQNSEFPQQSTGDQWFDEAQFESYRRLGEYCAEKVLDELGLAIMLAPPDAKDLPSQKDEARREANLEADNTKKLTPKMIECAFNIAKQIYDEHIYMEGDPNELLEMRKNKFKEKLDNCINPKPDKVPEKLGETRSGLFGSD